MPVVKLSGMTAILSNQALHDALGIQSQSHALHLVIFKGVLPTRAELDAFVNLPTFRTNDKLYSTLLDQQVSIANGFELSSSQQNSAVPVKPTWYALCGVSKNSNQLLSGIICGDVGIASSGASLRLEVSQFADRTRYKVEGFSLKLPINFTY